MDQDKSSELSLEQQRAIARKALEKMQAERVKGNQMNMKNFLDNFDQLCGTSAVNQPEVKVLLEHLGHDEGIWGYVLHILQVNHNYLMNPAVAPLVPDPVDAKRRYLETINLSFRRAGLLGMDKNPDIPLFSHLREKYFAGKKENGDILRIGVKEPEKEIVNWVQLEGRDDGSKDNTDIYIKEKALEEIMDDLEKRGSMLEAGGIVVGIKYPKNNRLCVKVTHYISIPYKYTPSTDISLQFTPDAWKFAVDELGKLQGREQNVDLVVVGWVHSRPGYRASLSTWDDGVNEFFSQDYQLAVVYDPIGIDLGFFSRGGSAVATPTRRAEFAHGFRRHKGYYLVRPS